MYSSMLSQGASNIFSALGISDTFMCGISALVDYEAGGWASMKAPLAMDALLRLRGPDGEGFLLIDPSMRGRVVAYPLLRAEVGKNPPKCMIAFRRLRIQDTTQAADQPLARCHGKLWIALNGEIY